MQTYRYYGHSKSDKREYRTKEEEAEWLERDPIVKLRAAMQLDDAAYDEMAASVEAEVEDAVQFARDSPEPEVEEWEDVVYA